jgi:hypothetical protein
MSSRVSIVQSASRASILLRSTQWGCSRDADEQTRLAVNGRIAIPQEEEQITSMGQVVGNFMRHLAGLLIEDAQG